MILAAAAALCLAGGAQAATVTFDDPELITFSPDGLVATYIESGFKIQGPALSFQLLDDLENPDKGFLLGGVLGAVPFSLTAVSGGIFSLFSLDFAFFDLGFGDPAGNLTISGLFEGSQVISDNFDLGALTTITFDSNWSRLTQVSFVGTSGFLLDNINVTAVPEPGTLALVGLAVAGLAITRRRAGQQSPMKPPPAATAM
jgi:hypothetical protein